MGACLGGLRSGACKSQSALKKGDRSSLRSGACKSQSALKKGDRSSLRSGASGDIVSGASGDIESGASGGIESGVSHKELIRVGDEDADLKSKHKVFLSHSGAQKDFVEHLCLELERCFRFPFFDKRWESLPIGEKIPRHIFAAISQCIVGVVIVSEEFFTSKWPMMELVAMVDRAKTDSGFIIMPIFLRTSVKEFKDPKNRIRWESHWHKLALTNLSRIEFEKWQYAVDYLNPVNGLEYDGSGEVQFQKLIVDAICRIVPTGIKFEDSYIQGRARWCKVILDKIEVLQNSGSNEVCVLGLYGTGGIGKTSICKALCNEYSTKFRGRVCLAELEKFEKGSKEELLREVVQCLSNTRPESAKELNAYELEDLLKSGDCFKEAAFIALDNLLDSIPSIKQVKRYLSAKLPSGSIVMVTAHSKSLLLHSLGQYISESNCIEMPELNMEEAKALFVKSCGFKNDDEVNGPLVERCVMRCCFKKDNPHLRKYDPDYLGNCEYKHEQYYEKILLHEHHFHPLALDVLGTQLGCISQDKWRTQLRMIDEEIFNQSREHDHPVFSVLRQSFDTLSQEDQVLFIDAALFVPDPVEGSCNVLEWLGVVHGLPQIDDVKSRLENLKKKSLLESLGDGTKTRIGMHDLWHSFCVAETKRGEIGCRRWAYLALTSSGGELFKTTPTHIWQNVERIGFIGCKSQTERSLLRAEERLARVIFAHFPNVAVFKATHLCMEQITVLELPRLTNLRSLEIQMIRYGGRQLPNMSNMASLCRAIFHGCRNVTTLSGLGPNLRLLDLRGCAALLTCPGVDDLVALEELNCKGCFSLEELPDLRKLTNLHKLGVSDCSTIKLRGVEGAVALVELLVGNSSKYGYKKIRLPDMRNLRDLQVLHLGNRYLYGPLPGFDSLVSLRKLVADFRYAEDQPSLGHLTKLQKLKIDTWFLEGLGELEKLVSLDIGFCFGFQLDLIRLVNLQSVKIADCEFKHVVGSGNVSALESLRIERCPNLNSVRGFSSLPRLKLLEIRDCPLFKGWTTDSATGLQILTLWPCEQLIFSRLETLECLEIGIPNLPDLITMPLLRNLTLRQCKFLETITSSEPHPTLSHLLIDSCVKFLNLPDLGTTFPVLLELMLDANKMVMMLRCSEPLTRLQRLASSPYTRWQPQPARPTTSTLPDLGVYFPALTKLELGGTVGLSALRSSAPLRALQVLELTMCGDLEELPDLMMFPALQSLDVHACERLSTLHSRAPLPALRSLDARNTRLNPKASLRALCDPACVIRQGRVDPVTSVAIRTVG